MQKQQHPIDDLFRRGLAEYEVTPSHEQRDAFIEMAQQKTGKRPSAWWGIAGLTTGVIIITGVIIAIFFQGNHREVKETVIEQKNATVVSGKNISEPIIQNNFKSENPTTDITSKTGTNSSLSRKPSENQPVKKSVPGETKPEVSLPASVQEALGATLTPTNRTNDAGSFLTDTISQIEPLEKKLVVDPGLNLLMAEASTQAEPSLPVPENPKNESTDKNRSQQPKNWNVSLGAYYTPEWMFNTLNGDKFANNTGIEGTFHLQRYSVRTGVGLSITTGSNEVLVKTNPYLGTYAMLDSVAFNWDENHRNLIPTYITSNKDIFDTTLQYNYSYIKKRYTYLQVPLILGYEFWSNRWLSMGVRGGAVMSVLLKTQNISGSYDAGKDSIITINDISPDRIRLNWQAVMGINASFRISRRFSIELEPEIRYYFNSVYESSEITKKPWSVGIRTAFIINF
jgi:cytoskeletal protein RodZ